MNTNYFSIRYIKTKKNDHRLDIIEPCNDRGYIPEPHFLLKTTNQALALIYLREYEKKIDNRYFIKIREIIEDDVKMIEFRAINDSIRYTGKDKE